MPRGNMLIYGCCKLRKYNMLAQTIGFVLPVIKVRLQTYTYSLQLLYSLMSEIFGLIN